MYLNLFLPECGEEGVMVITMAGAHSTAPAVEVRGCAYSQRTGDAQKDGHLWEIFDGLYPSKTSALMADEVATMGRGQGCYSQGYEVVAAAYFWDVD